MVQKTLHSRKVTHEELNSPVDKAVDLARANSSVESR